MRMNVGADMAVELLLEQAVGEVRPEAQTMNTFLNYKSLWRNHYENIKNQNHLLS